jgi:hypothetical protein
VVVWIALIATVGLAAAQSPVGKGGVKGLSLEDLQTFVYDLGENSSVEGGKVPLSNGKWSDGGGSTFSLHRIHAIGDLDGDGSADAAAIVVESTGGAGTFSYLFALVGRNGKAVQVGEPEWLGDRSVVQRLTIDRKGVMTIRYLTHADGDRPCCPTMKIEDKYKVEGGRLVGLLQ